MLTELAKDIWELNQPQKFFGIENGHRMTVIRLEEDLLVHSPVELTRPLAAELQELGYIRYIIAPNRMHDLYLVKWFAQFPAAVQCCAPGLEKEHPQWGFTEVLTDVSPAYWQPTVKHHMIQGMPKLNEFVFLHKPSRSLIVADLVFNIGGKLPFFSKLFWEIEGSYNKLTPNRLFKAFIKDRAAMRASLETVFAWDFDRIIVGHGANVETGGKEKLREALAGI